MVLTVSFALSPVTGLVCHRRPRTNVVPKPGRADITSANLTPASGRQDHATSPYATTSFVSSPFDRSQVFQLALPSRCAPDAAASTASHPASLTIRIRPSVGRDTKSSRSDLGCVGTEIFFGKSEIRLDRKSPAGRSNSHTATAKANFSQVMQRPGSSRLATSVSTLTGGSQATVAFRACGFTTAGAGTLLRATLPVPRVTGRRIRTEVSVSTSCRSEIVRVGAAVEPTAPSARSTLAVRLMASEILTTWEFPAGF